MLLARGYLRLLEHQAAVPAPAPALGNLAKPLDSCGPKSVNVLGNNGERDA
jgi:hypothetical protein